MVEWETRLKEENESKRAEQSCPIKPMEKGFAVLRSVGVGLHMGLTQKQPEYLHLQRHWDVMSEPLSSFCSPHSADKQTALKSVVVEQICDCWVLLPPPEPLGAGVNRAQVFDCHGRAKPRRVMG